MVVREFFRLSGRARRASTAVAVTSALLTVCVLAGGTAAAASPSAAATAAATPVWAYGALDAVHFHGTTGNYTYSASATYGLSAILNQTHNASTGEVSLHATRTIGVLLSLTVCAPDCLVPHATANYSYHAWEETQAVANLTTHGVVNESGGNVPALALQNSSVSLTAGLREFGETVLHSKLLRERLLDVNVSATTSLNLSTPLGIFPLAPTPSAAWNSASSYHLTGLLSSSWYSLVAGSLSVPHSISRPTQTSDLTAAGAIALAGQYASGDMFAYAGASYPALNLTISGPFALSEGVILIPTSADLFEKASEPWSTDQSGSAVVTTERLDIGGTKWYHDHLPIVASGFSISSSTSDAVAPPHSAVVGGVPVPAVAGPAATGNTTFVQGQPETVGTARSDEACLVADAGCPSGKGPGLPVRLLILGGAVAVVGAILAAAVVSRRRPAPPVYPNAVLYPPGAVGGPVAAQSPAPPPTPAEDDPLSHLW
jgi:hypothetical protein